VSLVFGKFVTNVYAVQYDGTNAADIRTYIDGITGAGPSFMAGSIIGNNVAAVHLTDWLVPTATSFTVMTDAAFSIDKTALL
jgi:hypothetical protein